ncbi:Calx-beta domain-containing protein [Paenibacillus nasutitermitis]|uniref:Calx-beta domain-containing protein n=1 Tax=Paenibacillus nasutitermitis TaxID=1652958 RepID=A0A916Z4M3_9BACL|nr:Calx-beta domain-containing protein [Paenibacillus nasutitermitis]GGD76044.1 hypothetical protein GCM10010911_37580 [Paenibacillus nasutitermitis]
MVVGRQGQSINPKWRVLKLLLPSLLILMLALPPGTVHALDPSPSGNFTFALAEAKGTEGKSEFTIRVLRKGGTSGQATVNYATSDGTAISGIDYAGKSGTLTFAPGVSEVKLRVGVIDNFDLDGDRDFYVTLSSPSAGAGLGAITNLKLTITDNERAEAGIIAFESDHYTFSEDDGNVEITLTRSPGATGKLSVYVTDQSGTATRGNDYDFDYSVRNVTFAEGELTKTLTFRIVNDILPESDESFKLQFESSGGAVLGAIRETTITITDDDLPSYPGAFTLMGGDEENTIQVYEDAGKISFWISRQDFTRDVVGDVTVDYTLIPDSAAAGSDYADVSGTLVMTGRQTSKGITIPIYDDDEDEGDEHFTIQLSNPTGGAVIGSPGTLDVIIMDNDDAPSAGVIQMKQASYNVDERNENDSDAIVTLVRSGGSDGVVSVELTTSDGTAVSPYEYEGVHQTVTFPAGVVSKEVPIPLYFTDGDKQFSVLLSNATGGASIGPAASSTVLIHDLGLKNGGTLSLLSEAASVDENDIDGNPTRYAYIDVRLKDNFPFYTNPTIDYYATSGTAAAGEDFLLEPGTLEIDVLGKALIPLQILDDDEFEGDESFTITITNPTRGASLGEITTITVTIEDNELAPSPGRIRVKEVVQNTTEDAGTVNVEVSRLFSNGYTGDVSIDYATGVRPGSAAPGSDYGAVSGTLVFKAGEMSKLIAIPVYDDTEQESTEDFYLTLSNPGGGAILDGDLAETRVLIADNDAPPAQLRPGKLYFETPVFNTLEETGPIRMKVLRRSGADGVVSVRYSLIAKTAAPGEDYVDTSGILEFKSGETERTFIIDILDDAVHEQPESFLIQLSDPTGGAVLGPNAQREVVIYDKDQLSR